MPEARPGDPRAPGGARPSRFRRWWSERVVVEDESMRPTLWPGDRLLVDRRAYRDRLPEVGEIVVLLDPEEPRRWLVKRVASVDRSARTLEVRGDAAELARDSRRFGSVPARSLVGRVYHRYFPAERRAEL